MMEQKTISENLWERFCKRVNWSCERLVPSSEKFIKTPDYELRLPSQSIVVEVKQIDPNDEDLRAAKDLSERGWSDSRVSVPGSRVREKINVSYKQLKSRSKGSQPTLLILYDNVSSWGMNVDSYQVRVGMYGLEQVVLGLPKEPNNKISVQDLKFGPKRSVSEYRHTALSCVGVIFGEEKGEELFLYCFQNSFAACAIDIEGMRHPKVKHFKLAEKSPGKFQEWIEL